jgi:predicted nuclease of predicted toxin-antitoxin system
VRLLADENLPLTVVQALRGAGHHVTWIRESNPGADDQTVLATALSEDALLLTQDKDFGELALRAGPADVCGILLIRMNLPPAQLAEKVVDTLASRTDWAEHFSVLETARLRMRPLPLTAVHSDDKPEEPPQDR